jgi:heme/copper-type cytochrome/quinol oxidase subunit 1
MQFADFNAIASVGGFAFGIAQVYFFVAVIIPAMRARIGSVKAAVFPVPVCAMPMRSPPASTSGIAAD